MGFVEYAEQVVASGDVFVMTSIWEGFPATLVEAMVLGTPVVSVNCESGPAELIESGVSGLLVAERDPRLIGEAILQLLNDPAKREAMGRETQTRVARFSLAATVGKLERLMSSLIQR